MLWAVAMSRRHPANPTDLAPGAIWLALAALSLALAAYLLG
jgi:hypothetical protein